MMFSQREVEEWLADLSCANTQSQGRSHQHLFNLGLEG